jgi:hypothetical protein
MHIMVNVVDSVFGIYIDNRNYHRGSATEVYFAPKFTVSNIIRWRK